MARTKWGLRLCTESAPTLRNKDLKSNFNERLAGGMGIVSAGRRTVTVAAGAVAISLNEFILLSS
jgi:hypothetical protein